MHACLISLAACALALGLADPPNPPAATPAPAAAPATQPAPPPVAAAGKAPTAAPEPARVVRTERRGLGTLVSFLAWGSDEAALNRGLGAAFTELERLDALLTTSRSSSQVLALNAAAGGAPVALRPELAELTGLALDLAERTEGAFDITTAVWSPLWRFSVPEPVRVVPPAEALARLKPLVGWRQLRFDRERQTLQLPAAGMTIGFGGLQNGYVADRLMAVLRGAGLRDCLVSVGGDVVASGTKGGPPWVVGVQDPRGPGYFATLAVRDLAVATAGDYERWFEVGGQRYHHILDPSSGQPARGLRSVTVLTTSAAYASGIATAVMVRGAAYGLQLAAASQDLDLIMVDEQAVVHVSPRLKGRLTIHRQPAP